MRSHPKRKDAFWMGQPKHGTPSIAPIVGGVEDEEMESWH